MKTKADRITQLLEWFIHLLATKVIDNWKSDEELDAWLTGRGLQGLFHRGPSDTYYRSHVEWDVEYVPKQGDGAPKVLGGAVSTDAPCAAPQIKIPAEFAVDFHVRIIARSVERSGPYFAGGSIKSGDTAKRVKVVAEEPGVVEWEWKVPLFPGPASVPVQCVHDGKDGEYTHGVIVTREAMKWYEHPLAIWFAGSGVVATIVMAIFAVLTYFRIAPTR